MLTLLFLIVILVLMSIVAFLGDKAQVGHREKPNSSSPIGPVWLSRLIPADPNRELVVAVIVSALMGDALMFLAIYGVRQYAWGIFVIAPFAVGFSAAVLASFHRETTRSWCILAGSLAVVTAGLGFLVMGLEGVICLLMAIPITVPCAVVGALFGFVLQQARRRTVPSALGMILCAAPLLVGVEPTILSAPPSFTVRTTIDIDAPPAVVWVHLVQFEPIDAPVDNWLFRAGVGYPISAALLGQGVGATRICDFSTGRFVETIRTWDENRELMFTVDKQPPPLREWTPYENIRPPHVEGYFLPEWGDFRLVPLGGNRTRLEGTSLYRNRMWPSGYWRVWSDAIVKQIHRRVFEHVKQRAEKDPAR